MAVLLPSILIPRTITRSGWINAPSGGKLSAGALVNPPKAFTNPGVGSGTQ